MCMCECICVHVLGRGKEKGTCYLCMPQLLGYCMEQSTSEKLIPNWLIHQDIPVLGMLWHIVALEENVNLVSQAVESQVSHFDGPSRKVSELCAPDLSIVQMEFILSFPPWGRREQLEPLQDRLCWIFPIRQEIVHSGMYEMLWGQVRPKRTDDPNPVFISYIKPHKQLPLRG